MRPWRRRRPAGWPQVPNPPPPPPSRVMPSDPTVVRLGHGGVVLDAPWGLACRSIANVWPEPELSGGWTRYVWPIDPHHGLFIAPVDLRVGHALEIVDDHAVIYGWIAAADHERFVLVPAVDAARAVDAAQHAFDVWHAGEVAAVTDEWRERLDAYRTMRERDG